MSLVGLLGRCDCDALESNFVHLPRIACGGVFLDLEAIALIRGDVQAVVKEVHPGAADVQVEFLSIFVKHLFPGKC